MKKVASLTWLVVGLFMLSNVWTQAAEKPVFTVKATVLNEGYVPEVSVSGRTLMGVMAEPSGDPNSNTNDQRLYLWLPAEYDTSGRACIALNSRDGQYSALLSVPLGELPPNLERPVPVNFVSDEPNYYEQYAQTPPPHRLAVLAEIKADCRATSERKAVLIAAWQPFSTPKTLIVLANSSRLETLLAVPVTDAERTRHLGVKCQPIEAMHRIAYDTACRLELDQLESEGIPKLGKMQLVRRRGASLAGTVAVELAL